MSEEFQLKRPGKWAVLQYKLRFYASYLTYYPWRWVGMLFKRGYLFANLATVNVEYTLAQGSAGARPAQRELRYQRVAGLRQLPIRSIADFRRDRRLARFLVVDITPSPFSGATMDPRIAILIGAALAKGMKVYYIQAEQQLSFRERQIKLLNIPHKSFLVPSDDLPDFSNLASYIEEC